MAKTDFGKAGYGCKHDVAFKLYVAYFKLHNTVFIRAKSIYKQIVLRFRADYMRFVILRCFALFYAVKIVRFALSGFEKTILVLPLSAVTPFRFLAFRAL